ncbi:MAG: hypothetical protein C0467_25335 [Planctomycetaceae bacterium]|nr:hypothetical protein [Planctomycetaceae bacterium]
MPDFGAFFLNEDGSFRPFTTEEVEEIEIETLGIEDGSHPRHSREVNQNTVACEYLINANYFERFCAFMLGGAKTYDDSGTTRLSRLMPQRWPSKPKFGAVKIPQTTNHVFESDDVASADFPIPTHQGMKVPVLFQQMPFEMYDDLEPTGSINETRRYLQTMPSQSQVDYLTLPGGIMRFTQETGTVIPYNKTIPHNVGKPLVQAVVSKKWHRIPYNAWGEGSPLYTRVHGSSDGETLPFLGTFNNAIFMGYEPGVLLLIGVDEEVILDQAGDEIAYNLTYKWLRKTPGHNHFYFYPTDGTGDNAGWYYVSSDGTWSDYTSVPDNSSLFSGRNHYELFRVGA